MKLNAQNQPYKLPILENFLQQIQLGKLLPKGILPSGLLTPEEALCIYHNGYVSRLTDALGEVYELVWKVVGDEVFFGLCKQFITQNPSQFWTLADYGKDFPCFLKGHEVSQEYGFLSDVASYGLAYHQVFHSQLEVGLENFEGHQELSDLQVQTVKQISVIVSQFNLQDIIECLKQDALPTPEQYLSWQVPSSLILWKKEHEIFYQSMTSSQGRALKFLQENRPIEVACATLDADEITETFSFLMKNRLIKKLVLGLQKNKELEL